jgi:Fe-S cluster assembly iron-binding protein IscA
MASSSSSINDNNKRSRDAESDVDSDAHIDIEAGDSDDDTVSVVSSAFSSADFSLVATPNNGVISAGNLERINATAIAFSPFDPKEIRTFGPRIPQRPSRMNTLITKEHDEAMLCHPTMGIVEIKPAAKKIVLPYKASELVCEDLQSAFAERGPIGVRHPEYTVHQVIDVCESKHVLTELKKPAIHPPPMAWNNAFGSNIIRKTGRGSYITMDNVPVVNVGSKRGNLAAICEKFPREMLPHILRTGLFLYSWTDGTMFEISFNPRETADVPIGIFAASNAESREFTIYVRYPKAWRNAVYQICIDDPTTPGRIVGGPRQTSFVLYQTVREIIKLPRPASRPSKRVALVQNILVPTAGLSPVGIEIGTGAVTAVFDFNAWVAENPGGEKKLRVSVQSGGCTSIIYVWHCTDLNSSNCVKTVSTNGQRKIEISTDISVLRIAPSGFAEKTQIWVSRGALMRVKAPRGAKIDFVTVPL